MFAKVDVKGDKAHPLYTYMTEQAPGFCGMKAVKWNFTKFLIGKDGKVVGRFAPQTKPVDLEVEIEKVRRIVGFHFIKNVSKNNVVL